MYVTYVYIIIIVDLASWLRARPAARDVGSGTDPNSKLELLEVRSGVTSDFGSVDGGPCWHDTLRTPT